MTLNKVQAFLDKAFDFLRDREFSVSREDWAKFCDNQGMSLEKLKSAKLELLRQNPKIDNESERLKNIFSCDPFDGEIIKSLRDRWYDKAESQPDPFQKWYYDISVHLLQIDTEKLESSPKIVNSVTPPITQKIPTANPTNLPLAKTHQLRNIIIILIPITIISFILGNKFSTNFPNQSVNNSQNNTDSSTTDHAPNFPLSSCGDLDPGGKNAWYPVFITNSQANLFLVRRDYCQDAFPKYRKEKGITSIQVASFLDPQKAEQFAQIMRDRIDNAEVGQPTIR
ncbi:MAG: hypothetical protein VKL41_00345 [Snowella sp.]|nr:hypothetical protein [Snowella sp.]